MIFEKNVTTPDNTSEGCSKNKKYRRKYIYKCKEAKWKRHTLTHKEITTLISAHHIVTIKEEEENRDKEYWSC